MNFPLYPLLATLAFGLLWLGFAWRHRRYRHAWLMSTGMALDLALVLTLELTKNAVATALGPTLTPWQLAHVVSSSLAVLFYFPVFTLGLIRFRRPTSPAALRTGHMVLGYVALSLRTLGYLTMFAMLER